ncbi:MAG TPA: hypothetical protein VI215_07930 [Bacteroidota bacterium]
MRAYLSGGMEYAAGEGVHWRRDLQQWLEQSLKHEVFNPNVESDRFFSAHHPGVDFRALKRDDVSLYRQIAGRLVEQDCREIAERSDYVICYWDEGAAKGAGTKGELTIARFFGKPIYLVTSYPLPEIPGWILGCVTRTFGTFDELKKFLSQ